MILDDSKGSVVLHYLERIILLAVIVLALQAVFPLHVIIILNPVRLSPGRGHHVEAGDWLEAVPGVRRGRVSPYQVPGPGR